MHYVNEGISLKQCHLLLDCFQILTNQISISVVSLKKYKHTHTHTHTHTHIPSLTLSLTHPLTH